MLDTLLACLSRPRRLALALTCAASLASAEPFTIVDEGGYEATFDAPVTRIVTLQRYNVEFARAIAGAEVIVGLDRSTWKDRAYWPELDESTVVAASQFDIDYERVVAQEPDLLLVARNGAWQEAREKLAPFGIPVVVLTGWDVLRHEENITLLGQLTGKPERAEAFNAFYRKHMDLLAERISDDIERPKVYFEAERENVTVLNGSGWHDMIAVAGGQSLFGDVDVAALPESSRNVNIYVVEPEAVAAANPDIVLRLTPAIIGPVPGEKAEDLVRSIKARPALMDSNAVRDNQVFLMSYHMAGGVSKMIGALQLAKWLHPDRFEDVDPEAVMREWIEDWQGQSYPGPQSFVAQP
ncbi:MAG: ABC transporter substrate-binding protein [Tropicimonas sp.]|uniref:ABC transporter substrate-binding protein n=1 Tax=Tropicimonas sp. TaxID=2067044 RepID=UPI003A8B0BC1